MKKIKFTLTSVPVVEKIFFVQNLALMIRTGFSIGDALSVLYKQTKHKGFRKVLETVRNDIVGGKSFASALGEHPTVFDDLFVSMVSAGETSGNLEGTLHEIVVQMKKTYTLKKRIRNAMMYPMLIVVLMGFMGTAVFIFVIPKVLSLYTNSNFALPLPTRVILVVSTFIQNNLLLLAVSIVSVVVFLILVWRTEPGRLFFNTIMLRTPILGKIIKQISIARISRVLNALITTDIPIVKGFQIISQTVGNRVFRKHLKEASGLLTKGNSIFSTIDSRPDLFEPVIAQMIKVGEDTGTLDEITNEIATFYEDEVDSTMANLTVIIEPVLMIFLGFSVGFLAVAIIMPIYGLVNQI